MNNNSVRAEEGKEVVFAANTLNCQVQLQAIGVIHSCFTEKFGIPRQPGIVPSATARLELLPPYNRLEMVRGLDEFSHIWVHFLFHQTVAEGWKPTVRPPRLGGRKRVGVFASRSPHRPNHMGLSVVKLMAVTHENGCIFLELSGIDFLDRTPVFDIKPYIPYSDALQTASGGYALDIGQEVKITFNTETFAFCRCYQDTTGRDLAQLIVEMICSDPRPASQRKCKKRFGMLLWDVNIRWLVEEDGVLVEECAYIKAR
jgi:tRNA (adenine37-N6)-methyltransferase